MSTTTNQAFNRRPLQRRANEQVTTGQTYPEDAANSQSPAILIVSNGSRWLGEEPADLAELLEVLKTEPLCPNLGRFISEKPISARTGKPLLPSGWISFWGNFHSISHVFHIITNDPTAIRELKSAILANTHGPAYKAARKQFAAGRSLHVA
jgi:hypothetical protein